MPSPFPYQIAPMPQVQAPTPQVQAPTYSPVIYLKDMIEHYDVILFELVIGKQCSKLWTIWTLWNHEGGQFRSHPPPSSENSVK